jgi:coniferyl-aldehyde dehydrogenase
MATRIKEAPSAAAPDMRSVLEAQRAAFLAELPVTAAVRKDRLMRAKALLLDNRDALARAVSDDFGHRSIEQTLLTDIMASVGPLNHAAKHVDRWMAREKRKLDFPLPLLGAKAWVEYQPKGVVGVIAPWNFPINLTFGPLAGILAAGNRAMVKPSEFTPATSELMTALAARYFAPEELAFVTGGAEVGKAFTELPFDHMIFTGATSIGRHVMRAAAENLVPVTLELGGKSPTILGRSADVAQATDRIATGKMMNAGQICLAPDYMLVPEEKEGEVVEGLKASAARLYPTLLANPDYTSVVNGRHRERLESYLADAREKGAEVVVVNPANEDFTAQNTHKMPLHIVRKVTDDMKVMQEEIFGPVLPVKTYRTLDEAVDYVNRRDRPLGLYYFGQDAGEERQVLDRTVSGGVTVNDVIMHISSEDLPFGGVGPSGMGNYHGHDGFKTFSHAKAVYKQPRIDIAKLAGFKPPYNATTLKTLKQRLK